MESAVQLLVKEFSSWICCQVGAREHYAVPRALLQAGQLVQLITDAWVPARSVIHRLPSPFVASLKERFHADLTQTSIRAFTGSLIRFELSQRIQKISGWERTIARNEWFQHKAIQSLVAIAPFLKSRPTLFAYSYAALELFRFAKAQGWRTILGQIDPGLAEEQLVLEEHTKHPTYQSTWQPAPPHYWIKWQEEYSLADQIVVNSLWSSQALQKVGIPKQKIDIVPLAYQPPKSARDFVRTYPTTFSDQRPLRVLFLGQVILRKGIVALLEAAEMLHGRPIEFWIVGAQEIAKPQSHVRIHWIDAVPRSVTAQYYQLADVFLFPTLSDGFGLTQLEAQAWKLPVIASKYCGDVVTDQLNGLRLQNVTGETISNVLQFCLNHPQQLSIFSQQAINLEHFSLLQLHRRLQALPYGIV